MTIRPIGWLVSRGVEQKLIIYCFLVAFISPALLGCVTFSCTLTVTLFDRAWRAGRAGTRPSNWLATRGWWQPGGLSFGGRGLTDPSAARVGGEIAGKQHAPTAGIREVRSTVSGDRDASALPKVQHMKLINAIKQMTKILTSVGTNERAEVPVNWQICPPKQRNSDCY